MNLPQGWVISARRAQPALVSEAEFIAALDVSTPRGPAGPAARWYLLGGLRCGIYQGQAARTGIAGVTAPDRTPELIDHLRAGGVTLIYGQAKRTLRTDTDDSVAVTISQNR